MGMLQQMLADLYRPVKQEKPAPLAGKSPLPSQKASSQASVPSAILEGQFLRGEVLDLRSHQILVLLENGATVSARTEGTLNLSIGEHARFFVAQTSEDQILLKLAKEDTENENPVIDKVLHATGITKTEKSVSIVTELLAHSQPVTQTNLRHFLSLSAKYPELPVKDLILMELHHIPVTKETVARFADYHNGAGQLLSQADALLKELSAGLEQLPEGPEKQQLLQEFLRILSPKEGPDTVTQTIMPSPAAAARIPAGQIAPSEIPPEQPVTAQVPAEHYTPSEGTAGQPAAAQIPAEHHTPSEGTAGQPAAAQIPSGHPEVAAFPATSRPLSRETLLPEIFLLSPEEIANPDSVKKYYEELNRTLEQLERFAEALAQETGTRQTAVPKQMRSNLSFMETLNQVLPFLQFPLKFKETPAHGELYVYERKKAFRPEDTIRALLHLDLDALGSMDIFLTLAGQHVTSRFSLTDADSARWIENELPSLSEALAKKGFSLQADVTTTEKEPDSSDSLLEQFLEANAPGGLTRYTFDIRA